MNNCILITGRTKRLHHAFKFAGAIIDPKTNGYIVRCDSPRATRLLELYGDILKLKTTPYEVTDEQYEQMRINERPSFGV